MQKCDSCGHQLYKESKYASWLTLMNFINFLQEEEYIEQGTAEDMRDHLMDFKPDIDEDIYDDLEGERRQRENNK